MIQIFNKKLRIVTTTTILLALIAVSTSIPATAIQREHQNGGTLRVGTVQEPADIFNPALWSQTGFPLLLYSGMLQWNENLELIPDLAEDWSVSADGLKITFVLREGLKFSDGQPLTSADVEFSARFFTEMSPTWSNYYRLISEDSNETLSGKTIRKGAIETPDERTVIFHVSEPSSTALTEYGGWYILPKHFFEGHDVTVEKEYVYQNPPTSGVFKLKEYVPGSHWWYERNEYYHTPAYLDGVIVQIFGDAASMEIALINGDIDHCWEWPSADWMKLSQYPQLELTMNPGWGIRFVWFNHDEKLKDGSVNPCADIRVRKAIYHAIDIPAVLDATVGAGFYELISQPQPTFLTVGGYSVQADLPTPLFEYNPETAKALLKDAGYEGGMKLKYYIRSGDPVILSMAQFFESYLDAVGIDLEIVLIEPTVFYDLVAFTAEPLEWHL
ncbi:MAG: ABC transporter substrate-binding protein, partial [bacterium]